MSWERKYNDLSLEVGKLTKEAIELTHEVKRLKEALSNQKQNTRYACNLSAMRDKEIERLRTALIERDVCPECYGGYTVTEQHEPGCKEAKE